MGGIVRSRAARVFSRAIWSPSLYWPGSLGGCPSGQRERSVKSPAYAYGGSNPPPPTNHQATDRLTTDGVYYVSRNSIRRTFGVFSQQYAVVVSDRLTHEDWRAVPSFDVMGRTGSPLRVVPERVGELTADPATEGLRPRSRLEQDRLASAAVARP